MGESWIRKTSSPWLGEIKPTREDNVADVVVDESNLMDPGKPAPTVVIHKPLKCPYCKSKNLKSQGTSARPILYYKCNTCKKNFKVLEQD